MNAPPETASGLSQPPSPAAPKRSRPKKATIPLHGDLHRRLNDIAAELTAHLGVKVTFTGFLAKTIEDFWPAEEELYRKLRPALRKTKSSISNPLPGESQI